MMRSTSWATAPRAERACPRASGEKSPSINHETLGERLIENGLNKTWIGDLKN